MSVEEFETEGEFRDLLAKKGTLIVVDFFAVWCGPCKAIAPKMKEWAKTHTDVTFCKVDVDALEEIAAEYKISAMPTIKFIKDGKEVAEVVGANIQKIEAMILQLTKADVQTTK